jgi:dihydrofolate synthase/folylpolyglutamate synthase
VTSRFPSLDQWLRWLEAVHPEFDLGLERVASVCHDLGWHELPLKIITVAGTNGKGSTVSYLEAALLASGVRVATYTSPHLVRYNERIRVDGVPVADDEIVAAFTELDGVRAERSLSYFEFSTLAAMHVFLRARVEVAVLEVGLGGRLDAVNVFNPDVCVITPIDIDHTHWLGEDRESIGREKAGILRAGHPVVISDPKPTQSVVDAARSLQAPSYRLGTHYRVVSNSGEASSDSRSVDWSLELAGQLVGTLPALAMRGRYQRENAATALVALKLLGIEIEHRWSRIRDAVGNVVLPGRFEVWNGHPTIVLDVAHNRHAMTALARTLSESFGARTVRAVVAMLADKAQEPALQEVASAIDHWYVGAVDYYRGESADNLALHVRTVAPKAAIAVFDSVAAAYSRALADASGDDVVLVFGSFYTVGEVMSIERRRPVFVNDELEK